MAKGIERVGDTGLKMELEFPDEKMREDFEIAFRGWLQQYKHLTATYRLTGALARKAAEDMGEDAAGYLFSYEVKTTYPVGYGGTLDKTTTKVYVDLLPFV